MKRVKLLIGTLLTVIFLSFSSFNPNVREMEVGQTTIFYVVTDMRGQLTSESDLISVEEMVAFLEFYDNWSFELRCHTDSRGVKEMNLKLSELRAKNLVFDLIQTFGINESRLIPVGCGEKFLIIPDSVIRNMANTKMKEYAHGMNRRYELKAIGLSKLN